MYLNMKQNVRKTDNRDLMTKLFDRGINVQGIAQSLYPELSQFQIHQMLCASGPYTKDDRNLLAQKIYNVWKTEASKPDYRLGESKNVKHVNESQLKSIIAESVKKVLKEGEYDSDMLAHRMEDYHQSNGEYYASEEWYVEFGKNKYNTEKYKGFESREEAEECANKIRNEHPEMKYVSVGVNGASKMMHESKTTNKLSESQLSVIVAESVKKVLKESQDSLIKYVEQAIEILRNVDGQNKQIDDILQQLIDFSNEYHYDPSEQYYSPSDIYGEY